MLNTAVNDSSIRYFNVDVAGAWHLGMRNRSRRQRSTGKCKFALSYAYQPEFLFLHWFKILYSNVMNVIRKLKCFSGPRLTLWASVFKKISCHTSSRILVDFFRIRRTLDKASTTDCSEAHFMQKGKLCKIKERDKIKSQKLLQKRIYK